MNAAGKYKAQAVAAKIISVKEKPLTLGYPRSPVAARMKAAIRNGAAPY